MNTDNITEKMADLPILIFKGKSLDAGKLYRVVEDNNHKVSSFFIMVEYFCYNKDKNDVKCFIYSLMSDNPLYVNTIHKVKNENSELREIYRCKVDKIAELAETDLDDPLLKDEEKVFFKSLQAKINLRKAVCSSTGHYPFVHFFTRFLGKELKKKKSINTHYACIMDNFASDYNHFWTNNAKFTFGVYFTETENSKDFSPVIVCHYDSTVSGDNADEKVLRYDKAVSSEIETLTAKGFEKFQLEENYGCSTMI